MNRIPRKSKPHGSFGKTLILEQLKERKEEFDKDYPNVAERLNEIRGKMIWARNFIDNLLTQLRERGYLTDNQLRIVTNMYIDNCAWTEEKVKEQQSARKLLYRLCECRTGRSVGFILSLLNNSDRFPLSPRQLSELFKLANRFRVQLDQIPEITDDMWDGWLLDKIKWADKLRGAKQLLIEEEPNVDKN